MKKNAVIRSSVAQKSSVMRRRFLVEQLEHRHLMAADFIVDASGKDVKLQRSGQFLQVIDRADNSVIRQERVGNIDSKTLEITSDLLVVDSAVHLDGNSLVVNADRIEVTAGSIISANTNAAGNSRADSGNISLSALQVVIGAGSTISAALIGSGNFNAGAVMISAVDEPSLAASLFVDNILPVYNTRRSSSVDLTGTTIRGAEVTINAEGKSATRWDDIGGFGDDIGKELLSQLQTVPGILMSAISPISGQAKLHQSFASVVLTDSVIESTGSVTISSNASSDASVNAVALGGLGTAGFPFLISLAFSRSDSTAKVDLLGSTRINADARVDITTSATSEAAVSSRADANSRASSATVEGALNVALAFTKEISKVNVAPGASITAGGSVKVDAKGEVVNEVSASTSVFQDGTGGLSVAVGSDNADITVDVHGAITSRASGEGASIKFADSNIDAARDRFTLTVPEDVPLVAGERITYREGSGDIGLVAGREYIVFDVTAPVALGNGKVSQGVRLTIAETIDLDSAQVPVNSIHSLEQLASIRFNAADVTSDQATGDGRISMPTLPPTVTKVTYLGPDTELNENATAIVGLLQNQEYEVVREGGLVKLRLPGTTAFIDFVAPTSDAHGFYYTKSVFSFLPSAAVDSALNTIQLPAGHDLKTGDLLFYGTDPTRTIARTIHSHGTGTTSTGEFGTVQLPDAPIRGLADEMGYRVVIDPDSPNLIRLTGSTIAAAAASLVDVTAGSATGHSFDRQAAAQGIVISASLEATNGADSGVALSDEEQPWPEVATGALSGQPDSIATGGYALLNAIRSGVKSNSVDKAKEKTGASEDDGRNSIDVAGSVAVALFEHVVHATVASTAVLISRGDLIVDGQITQETTLSSAAEATRRGVDDEEAGSDPQQGEGDTEIALAVGVGIYENNALAVIADGARTDANRDTNVNAKVDYPLLVASATDAINPATTLANSGLSGFDSMMDGMLGLSQLFNVQTRAIAGSDGDKLALAGAVIVTDYTNSVVARIGQNALVNQNVNLALRDPSVTVDSELTARIIEAGQMSSINLSIQGFLEAFKEGITKPKDFFGALVSPLGVSGKKAAGGVFLITLADNTTMAEIGAGARVTADGPIIVDANSDFYNVSVVQTGTGSTDFGFSAAVTAADIDSKTISRIVDGAVINAGSIDMDAKDVLDRIAIAGAFLKGKQIGIGVSVGVNLVDQEVAAYIGREDRTLGGTAPAQTTLTVSGPVDIDAVADGDIFSLVMAGAAQGFGKNPASSDAGGAESKADSKQIGAIALTIPVGYNEVRTEVAAYVDHQAGAVTELDINADSRVEIQSIVVGASFAVQKGAANTGKVALAGAGAVAINNVVQDVAAYINSSNLLATSAGGIRVTARDRSEVEADAGGFAIAAAKTPQGRAAVSFGVSVAINDVSGTTTAFVNSSDVGASIGSILVEATSTAVVNALSIAGGASAQIGTSSSGSFGSAGAGAQNAIEKSLIAEIRGDSGIVTGGQNGSLTVQAIDSSQIKADAGGVGMSLTKGAGTSISGAIGVSIALNEVNNTIYAGITSTESETSGDTFVVAKTELAKIEALTVAASAGAAEGAGTSVALAGAGSGAHNLISNDVTASIRSSNVTSQNGMVTVDAADTSTIESIGIGASIALGASGGTSVDVAVGISISKNEIDNTVTAFVSNSGIQAMAPVAIRANQASTINATAVAASLGAGVGSGTGVAVSGAGAGAINEISNKTIAYADASIINSSNSVAVNATDTSTIRADIIAAAAALAGGSTGVGAAFGISVAENRMGDASTYTNDPTGPSAADAARVIAYVKRTQIDASGIIDVNAQSTANITARVAAVSLAAAAGRVGVAVAGAGVSATNDVEIEVAALIDNALGSTVTSDVDVNVNAQNSTSIVTTVLAATLAAAAGKFSAGVGVAVASTRANVNNKIYAGIRRTTVTSSFGTVKVSAQESANVNSTATAGAAAISIGLGTPISGGGVIASGTIESDIDAEITDSEVTGAKVDVYANSDATSDVQTEAIAISIGLVGLGASGSVATSTVEPTIDALVSGSNITASRIHFHASYYPLATADAAGLTVSSGLAVGVARGTVEIGGHVKSRLDTNNGKEVKTSDLWIDAALNQSSPSRAFAQGASGGLLIGVDATVTSSTNTATVASSIADNSTVDANAIGSIGSIQLTASGFSSQEATSSSFALGLIAAGVTSASAESDIVTSSTIGNGAQITGNSLRMYANGYDRNFANTTAGAAGGISGAVALPSTSTRGQTLTTIGNDVIINMSQDAVATSYHRSEFDSTLFAVAGGVLSGGGGDMDNVVDRTMRNSVGDRARITGQQRIAFLADAEVFKGDSTSDPSKQNVDATTGGFIAGVGVDSDTTISLRTQVVIGAAAELIANSDSFAKIDLLATNQIDGADELTLRSGGIAAGGITNSSIRALVDEATVTVGQNAKLDSSGNITVYARGRGNVNIQANAETYGAATVGAGISVIDLRPVNHITFVTGSMVEADRDIHVSAGTDTSFNRDVYEIEARVDSFAGSAIPIDIMDATATLIQDNRIHVASGATMRSAGDIRLHAERSGFNNVLAMVKAVNWVTGVAGAIDGLLAEGGVEQFGGTAVLETTGIVNVEGTVQTGIARMQVLEITSVVRDPSAPTNFDSPDFYTVNVSPRTTGEITFSKALQRVITDLDIAIENAQSQLRLYGNNPQLRSFYEGELQRYNAQLERQGLLVRPAGAPADYRERVERNALSLVINPVFAKAGSIDIRADSLSGNGTLDAPADASVEIINLSQAFLDIRGINIPQNNGGVYINGQIRGTQALGTPSILVENRADVTSPSLTNNGQLTFAWPSITVNGTIDNLGGSVTLKNFQAGAGNILTNAAVRAQTQTISAGLNGAVTINSPTLEVAGVEHSKWNRFTQTGDGASFAEGRIPVFGQFIDIVNPEITNYLNNDIPIQPSLSGNRIFINANHINVNGLIRSGKDEYNLTIGQNTASEIAQLKQSVSSGIHTLQTVSNPDFILRFDIDRNRIIVEELRASGGYVDMTGHVANTHNGEIHVFGDYASISVDNQTLFDLEIKRLDVSTPGEGTVIIKDFNKGGGANNPGVTIYQREGDVLRVQAPEGNFTVNADFNFLYQPKNGLRYGWTIAQDQVTTTRINYASSSWLGIDALAADPADEVSRSVEPAGPPRILDAGPYYYTDPSDSSRYAYTRQFIQLSSRTTTCCNRSETTWYGTTTYYTSTITETGTRTLHTHTIEADRPIDIRFSGKATGTINVTSGGSVFVSGELSNLSGVTSIQSQGSILQGSGAGVVGGREVNITAVRDIGTVGNPLQTNVADTAPFDYISNQGNGTTQVAFNRGTRVKIASGHTSGGAVGQVYEYISDVRQTLSLGSTNYADTSRFQHVPLFVSIGLTTTDGHIVVREIDGNLPIRRVQANKDGSSTANGDVHLTAEGSIITRSSFSPQFDDGFIDGNSIYLVAETGSIGTLEGTSGFHNQAISADAGYFNAIKDPRHRLTATAATDIYLKPSTTMIIDTVVAGGDVRIDFVENTATLLDGNENAISDERSLAEVSQMVWSRLQLTEGLGVADKQNERRAALIATQTLSYNAYWSFRSTQADPSVYDPNHRVLLLADERAFYEESLLAQGTSQGLSGTALDQFIANGITTLENSRTTQYHSLHSQWGSRGNARIADFQYELTSEENEALDESLKIWTEEELLALRPVSFLNVTDTEFLIEEPNIIGRNVTINATGGIGRYANGTTIDIRPQNGVLPLLSLEEHAVLAAAEPNDIVYLMQAPVAVIASILASSLELVPLNGSPADWSALGFAAGQSIYMETNTRDTTDDGLFFTINRIQGSRLFLDTPNGQLQQDDPRDLLIARAISNPAERDQATHLRVLRREDIDLNASGVIRATSRRHIYLGSELDMAIHSLNAGANDRVQVKAGGAITNAAENDNTVNFNGQRIVLESSTENLGSFEKPLRMSTSPGGYLIARGNDDVVIVEVARGNSDDNLLINQVFSRQGAVSLEAAGSILDAFNLDTTRVRARDILLTAGGTIGSANDYFDIDLIGEGVIDAWAGSHIRLNETVGNLGVQRILSETGNVELVADVSILDAGDVTDPYDRFSPRAPATPGNPRADVIGQQITLTAKLGGIGVAGDELDLDSNFGNTSNTNPQNLNTTSRLDTYLNEVTGDLFIGAIATTNPNTNAFLTAFSGSIFSGTPGLMNLTAGKLWLVAAQDIGAEGNPIRTTVGFIEGEATAGDVFIQNDGFLVIGEVVGPPSGSAQGEEPANGTARDGLGAGGQVLIVSNNSIFVKEGLASQLAMIVTTAGQLTIGPNGSIQSRANATLNSAGNVSFNAGSQFVSTNPSVLNVGLGLPAPAASQVDLRGGVTSPLLTIVTSAGGDQFNLLLESLTGRLRVESGDGNDQVTTNQPNTQFVGGAGTDVLQVLAGVLIDLQTLPAGAIAGVETIDMTTDGATTFRLEGTTLPTNDSGAPVLFRLAAGDRLQIDSVWQITASANVNGEVVRTATRASTNTSIQYVAAAIWQNALNFNDIDGNGSVQPLDALTIINELNGASVFNPATGLLVDPTTLSKIPVTFFDTDGDGRLLPLDALIVINHLNRTSQRGQAEVWSDDKELLHYVEITPPSSRLGAIARKEDRERLVDDVFGEW